jgi:hypothetical protein
MSLTDFEKPTETRSEDKAMQDERGSLEKGQESGVTWTHEEERAALRRLDWNLIPL